MKTSMAALASAAIATGMALSSTTVHGQKQRVPGCNELVWSAQVMEANPDIRLACQGVYSRGGDFFAKLTIELTRVQGNRLSFRPLHVDGSKGPVRSITVPNSWRVVLDERPVRAAELLPGQRLNVYMPQDRFALTVDGSTADGDDGLLPVE